MAAAEVIKHREKGVKIASDGNKRFVLNKISNVYEQSNEINDNSLLNTVSVNNLVTEDDELDLEFGGGFLTSEMESNLLNCFPHSYKEVIIIKLKERHII